MDDRELLEETESHIRLAASQVARRFKGFITYADMAQEGNLWVLTHKGTVQNLLEDNTRGKNHLVGRLSRHMEKLARKERAASIGYKPEDEAFYARTLVEAALPSIWDDSLLQQPPTDEMATEAPRRRSDASETGNWLATVIDVRAAWDKADLDHNWKLALYYRYGEGLRIYQVADLLEVSDSTVTTYINKGLSALVRELGGRAPGGCPPDCECGAVGNRRAISNAQAQARLENDYE